MAVRAPDNTLCDLSLNSAPISASDQARDLHFLGGRIHVVEFKG
jgi:hypothetical protein